MMTEEMRLRILELAVAMSVGTNRDPIDVAERMIAFVRNELPAIDPQGREIRA